MSKQDDILKEAREELRKNFKFTNPRVMPALEKFIETAIKEAVEEERKRLVDEIEALILGRLYDIDNAHVIKRLFDDIDELSQREGKNEN